MVVSVAACVYHALDVAHIPGLFLCYAGEVLVQVDTVEPVVLDG